MCIRDRLATFKHISSKNADYGAAEQYLTFEHDEFTMRPTLDENGRLVPREDYRIATLNCGEEDFAVACMRSNLRYGKNQKREEMCIRDRSMVKGLYTAYTGMINEQKRLDVLSNNLANADTNGYKKEGTTSQTFADELAIKIKDTSSYGLAQKLGTISMGVHIGETYTDYSTGSFKVTDNSTDFAIKGDGFFAIAYTDKQGNSSVKYTSCLLYTSRTAEPADTDYFSQ